MEPLTAKVIDIAKVQKALDRAARNARHGPSDAKAGRMLHVESSVMTGVDYDEDTGELDIRFASGKTYRYFGVPPDVPAKLLDAESKGAFFNGEIKGAYRYAEVRTRNR